MNDITSISLSHIENLANERCVSSSNLIGNIECKAIEKEASEDVENSKESTNKRLTTMSISSSMQNHEETVIRSNKSLSAISSELNENTGSSDAVSLLGADSASFSVLSRRESSLENLAEDDNGLQNTSASPFLAPSASSTIDKAGLTNISSISHKKVESSRIRRTLSSLLSCCTQKLRRSQYLDKNDLIASPSGSSDTIVTVDKCSNIITQNRQVACRSGERDHISFSCIKLKKFFDMFDESDSPKRRLSQSCRSDNKGPIITSSVTPEGDKSDSPSKNLKTTDNFQSENGGPNLTRPILLGTVRPSDNGKKCFIIDLDETLVHSSFKMVEKADFKVGVDIEGTVHTVYVLKRPYVDVFLQKMGRIFECVLFTASLAKYADPVTDFLDKWHVFRWRLFRESCVFHRGNYVKDLSMLGRHTDDVAILDNSPASYMFHPDNAVQITSWFDDPRDTALLDLIPYFEQLAAAPSVPPFLASVKPPQRATVPVNIMLASPCSLSLQPISQSRQQQPQQSSSPITNVDTCSDVTINNIQSENTIIVNSEHHLPNTSIYIRDINNASPFSRSLKSLSSILSKSLPSIFAVECTKSGLRKFRSETDLNFYSSVQKEIILVSKSKRKISDFRISKSVSNIPNIIIDNISVNHVTSRSFSILESKMSRTDPWL